MFPHIQLFKLVFTACVCQCTCGCMCVLYDLFNIGACVQNVNKTQCAFKTVTGLII